MQCLLIKFSLLSTTLRFTVLPSSPIFVSSFCFFTNKIQFVLCIYSSMCVLPLEHDQLTRSYILKETHLFLCMQLSNVKSSWARDEILCSPPLSMLGFGLAGVRTGLSQSDNWIAVIFHFPTVGIWCFLMVT